MGALVAGPSGFSKRLMGFCILKCARGMLLCVFAARVENVCVAHCVLELSEIEFGVVKLCKS